MSARDIRCDVLVVGGSTSALFAALHAAREGALTCLTEPTDWAGGQLTAGGVPAIDFAWRSDVQGVDTKKAHRLRVNNHYEFYDWLQSLGNPGNCSVSRHCFLPVALLDGAISDALEGEPNLSVLNNTVPVAVRTRERGHRREITGVTVLRRFPKPGGEFPGYERPFSEAVSDWYSRYPSAYFHKQQVCIRAREGKVLTVVEASEFGDVLALSNARYLVGEDAYEGATEREYCASGQSFTSTFNLSIAEAPVHTGNIGWTGELTDREHTFDLGTYGWAGVWTYRRLNGEGDPAPGQTSVMNWKQGAINNGNDYADAHLFLSYEAARNTVENDAWCGGINVNALRASERLSRDFCRWYISQAPEEFKGAISVDNRSVRTGHGFYKFPYLRESRRSIGYNGFLLCAWDLSFYPGPTGYPFCDRVGTTVYDYDIHALNRCGLKTEEAAVYWAEHPKPFFIPLRSLSNDTVSNLVVAGKCMAQSFRANAATRLQPGEVVSGTAAGVVAAYCFSEHVDVHQVIDRGRFQDIQSRVARYQPLEWTIDGERYPQSDSRSGQENFHKQRIPDANWSDSLAAYFDREFVYFSASCPDLARVLPRQGAQPGLLKFEDIKVDEHRFLKFPKMLGLRIIKLRRGDVLPSGFGGG
ncbi:MAG: FAD-dependent oxidoreductase [Hyphomonadaceae bacterium]|nr:FAD-dependent oxidoreductase [Hyphomonadaceae bacterium]